MNIRRLSLAIVTAGALLLGSTLQAATLSFYCITGNLAGDCAIGEAQLTVEVTDLGGSNVAFRFLNTGLPAASISEVYFDDGTLLGLSSVVHSAGRPWTGGSASPPNLPGGNSISPAFQTTAGFLAESNPSPSLNGVRPGEWLDVFFTLQGGGTIADILDELTTGELRIGMHVIAFASGGSESFVNNPIPVPAAVWLFGSALALMGWMRRRPA